MGNFHQSLDSILRAPFFNNDKYSAFMVSNSVVLSSYHVFLHASNFEIFTLGNARHYLDHLTFVPEMVKRACVCECVFVWNHIEIHQTSKYDSGNDFEYPSFTSAPATKPIYNNSWEMFFIQLHHPWRLHNFRITKISRRQGRKCELAWGTWATSFLI